ncbi:13454_t:CDS:1 [Funneliformis mosseae]|uniref:13454_t:CDS:1 n=1 Tax=Funneliformis mosseae TaxID=27381 RepID=A0A9N8Z5P0_FUNMO|nr:13454_t:CDS:1 [Funneliformis mosseae]
MAINCLSANEDEELLAKIKDTYIFHVSYENRTSLQLGENPFLTISTRMLLQLLEEKMKLDDVLFKYESSYSLSVILLIAEHQNCDLKNITVILIIDSMQ